MRLATDNFNLEWCEVHKSWCVNGECWECHDDENQLNIKELEREIRDLNNVIDGLKKEEPDNE